MQDGIDIPTIELIHGIERQQDGYVGLCAKINDRHQDLAGVRIDRLREYLPGILDFILEDSYFTVNASYRVKPYNSKLTGLSVPERREKCLRYLNSTYADLDYYRAGNFDFAEVVATVKRAQDANRLPPASIIGRSGRGAYLLWLLTSERHGAQQRAFPHEIQTYKQINRAIIERLDIIDKRLGADHIFDAARILRIPGSTNTKAQEKVLYDIQVTRKGIPVYTLSELAHFFGLPSLESQIIQDDKKFTRAIKNRLSCPRRRLGREQSAEYRLQDIQTISAHIGGFPQGKRCRLLVRFIQIAKTAGFPKYKIVDELKGLAAQCRPPYPSDPSDVPLQKLIDAIWIQRTRSFYNSKLAWEFNVTSEMAEELQLHSIIPDEIKAARAALPKARTQQRKLMKNAVKEILSDSPGKLPSNREMVKLLAERGIKTNHTTVGREIKALRFFISESPNYLEL